METLRIKASLDKLSEALDFIEKSATGANCPKGLCNEILTACEEVIVNIISYAYPNGEQGAIDIAVESAAAKCIEITVSDHGRPFNPLSFPDPDTHKPIEERQIGGLGIFLVKNLMDDISYSRNGDANVIRLLKRLDTPEDQG